MDLRQAAQAALEVLDYIADCVDGHLQDRALTAIDALRAALAQQERCPASHVCDCQEAGQPCAKQQEQTEPVAFMLPRDGDECAIFIDSQDIGSLELVKQWVPLYTAPPKRKPHSINYVRVQEIAAKRRLNYNDFAAALRDYIGGEHETT